MHCHLLPGVDDGSHDISETVACLKTMAEVGFKKVFFTPHFQAKYPNNEEDIQQRFAKLKQELSSYPNLPEVAAVSGEYRFDPLFARRPGVDKVVLLPNNMLLSEFSLHDSNYMPFDTFMAYLDMHYTLILAHPERYPYLNVNGTRMEQLKNQGVYFQTNVLSLGGFYGEEAKKRAYQMIERGWVEFMGTDTHNTMYAQALVDLSHDRKVEKILEKYEFMNKTL
jgi:tyrosine-protein phosphatase YwqE